MLAMAPRPPLFLSLLVLFFAGGQPPNACAKEPPPTSAKDEATKDSAAEGEVTPKERDDALKKCFRFLDEHLWTMTESGSSRKFYAASMAGWAYLICSTKPKNGRKLPPRSKEIKRIAELLNGYADRVKRAYEQDDKRASKKRKKDRGKGALHRARMFGRTAQYVWNLGVAAHFFAASVARGKARGPSKRSLKTVVKILEACQQEDGGWGHDDARREGMGLPAIKIPKPGGGSFKYPETLLGASNCALSGIGAARAVLGGAPTRAMERGRDYFLKAQNGSGTFPYDTSQRRGGDEGSGYADRIGVARTSGSVLALLLAGLKPKHDAITRAIQQIDAHPEWLGDGHGSAAMALGFSAVLASARGEKAWKVFRSTYFRKILEHQQEDGGCNCVCNKAPGVTNDTKSIKGIKMPAWVESGRIYVTAIHALILALDRAPVKSVPAIKMPHAPVVTGVPSK